MELYSSLNENGRFPLGLFWLENVSPVNEFRGGFVLYADILVSILVENLENLADLRTSAIFSGKVTSG